jgi:pyruvate kinase
MDQLPTRKVKIVATIGPASSDERTLSAMLDAGMNVARLNFSHGTHAEHQAVVALLRGLAQKKNIQLGILADLQGPKVRIGEVPAGPIVVKPGDVLTVTFPPSPEIASQNAGMPVLHIPIPGLLPQLKPGMKILMDDGRLEFTLTQVLPDKVLVQAVYGGTITSRKGFNLPGVDLDLPAFTEKDCQDLHFALDAGVDFIAVSFVRTPADLASVRQEMAAYSRNSQQLPLIAKLERPEALDNLEAIIESADAVMVARGDLGVELSPALVPVAQKRIIQAANQHARPVITATQMLESMVNNPSPTRAEAADVANAVFDGTDAVMLSAETASGMFPVESIHMMDMIVRDAEAHFSEWSGCLGTTPHDTSDDAVAMTQAAKELARDREVCAIAVFTQTGRTALLMSKTQPVDPILGFSPVSETCRRMALYRGVTPVLIPFVGTTDAMIQTVDSALTGMYPDMLHHQVVLIAGFPVSRMRAPNFALLHTVGES